MKQSQYSPLFSISPIDGRYRNHVVELSDYSSEFGLIKCRTEIEIRYLIALSKIGVIRKLKTDEIRILEKTYVEFSLKDAEKNKDIAQEYWKSKTKPTQSTKHDVKAVEYYLKEKLAKTSLSDILEYIHFGLTSEDINNLSIRILLKKAIENVLIPNLETLGNEISDQSKKNKKLVIIGRTHGQAAIPTTLGKEFLVFYKRLEKEIKILKQAKLYGKVNGAIGNYSALSFVFPKINWPKFSKDFVSSFDLNFNETTNQIAPFEDIIYIFQTVQRINGILLDFDQDMWRYISDHWFVQEKKNLEVGSSTMPQKINPIMFENSEGNLTIANAITDAFVNKLPLSRLQRDLSNSTISRNFGLCLAYSLLAYKNCLSGLRRIHVDEEKIKEDLNSDWSILSEAVQIYLKKHGVKEGYEILKNHTRGQNLNEESFKKMIDDLPIKDNQKEELKKLSPQTYIGIL